MAETFNYYPEIIDPAFDLKIYRKKEFYDTRVKPDIYEVLKDPEEKQKYLQERCGSNFFRLQNYQQFVRNYISPATPYRGLLLYHGVGSGKTCAAVQIAEGFKEDVINQGQKIIVLAKKSLQDNMIKNLYDFNRESASNAPGQNQCTGNAYYIPETPGQSNRKDIIENKIKTYYDFYTNGDFKKNFDNDFGDNPTFESDATISGVTESSKNLKKLRRDYDNTIYIIDEAQLMIAQKQESDAKVSPKKIKTKALGTKAVGDATIETEADEADEADEAEIDAAIEDVADEAEVIKEIITREIEEKKEKEEAQKIYQILMNYILPNTQNVRIILLTATPMRNTPVDLVKLVNLLRMNDYKKPEYLIDISKFEINSNVGIENPIEPKEAYNVNYLKPLIAGYISYIRGENPLTFARKEFADDYMPRPIFDQTHENILMNLNNRDADRLRKPYYLAYSNLIPSNAQVPASLMPPMKFKMVECPMSLFQYYYYLYQETRGFKVDSLKQRSLIVFPSKITATGQLEANLKKPNRKNTFVLSKTGWTYNPALNTNVLGTGPLLLHKNIKYISSKYGRFLDFLLNPQKNKGTHYVYSFFIANSAEIIAAILEQNGFKPYSIKRPNYILAESVRPRKADRRCYCGCICRDHTKCVEEAGIKEHKFSQATYFLYTSATATKEDLLKNAIETFNNQKNMQGQLIKVIIGTKTASVGVDYKRIRHMHIMDPWYNMTEIDQTIGRAIRQCAHYDLPPIEQKVTIYHYVATPPPLEVWKEIFTDSEQSYWKNKFTDLISKYRKEIRDQIKNINQIPMRETSDEREYRRSYVKDRYIKYVERAVKEVAVDCNFNYYYNIYPDDTDFPGTRVMEYQDDTFKCQIPTGMTGPTLKESLQELGLTGPDHLEPLQELKIPGPDPLEPGMLYEQTLTYDQLDLDTFRSHRYFIEPILREIRNNIMDLYQRNFVLDLETIESLIFSKYQYDIDLSPTLQKEYLHLALSQLVGNDETPPIEIRDPYQRRGFLIFRQPYYVFHPMHIRDSRLPIYYREIITMDRPPNSLELGKMASIKEKAEADISKENYLLSNIKKYADSPIDQNRLLKFKDEWDRFPLETQQSYVESAVPLLKTNPNSSFLQAFLKHFQDQLLVLTYKPSESRPESQSESRPESQSESRPESQSESRPESIQWFHGFTENILVWNDQKRRWTNPSDKLLNALVNPNQTLINEHLYYKRVMDDTKTNIRPGTIKNRREDFTLPAVVGFFNFKSQFLILDVSDETIKTKKDSTLTNKSTMKQGRVCGTGYSNEDIIKAINLVKSELSQKNPPDLSSLPEKPSKDQLCNYILYLLRELDLRDPKLFHLLNQETYPLRKSQETRTNAKIVFDRLTQANPFIKKYLEANKEV